MPNPQNPAARLRRPGVGARLFFTPTTAIRMDSLRHTVDSLSQKSTRAITALGCDDGLLSVRTLAAAHRTLPALGDNMPSLSEICSEILCPARRR